MRQAYVFVAVLGASNYTYAEASFSQDLFAWIGAHCRAFEYFGGVPEIIVPDNLKAGVAHPSRYEPDLNPQMRLSGMAEGFVAQQRDPDCQSLSFEERLGRLVDQEWTYRQDKRLARLLKEAKLRLAACPEDIDYREPRGLDRGVMAALATGQ